MEINMPRRVTRAGMTENLFSICFTIRSGGPQKQASAPHLRKGRLKFSDGLHQFPIRYASTGLPRREKV